MESTHSLMTETAFQKRLLTESVERACQLAALSDEVASVIVVPGRRPRYEELLAIREFIATMPLLLSVRADGSIAVRKAVKAITPESKSPPPAIRVFAASERRAISLVGHFYSGLANWNAGFNGIREGLR